MLIEIGIPIPIIPLSKNGKPNKYQVKSLIMLLNHIKKIHNIVDINTHSDFGKENCPGYDLEKIIKEYNNNPWRKK